ncbi:hypothetical protein PB2503_07809 [Parvularcula bermudensis HTCC2503]|uniref:CHAD domain-containing protein n=1 Tax=Parvularcula bermudensis (strain ATCC BAA-594 / HTCC2503 / KCTC 12087) TaxID=314260 RepID=E0TGJ8_PARBH|nr:CHAD domain-containing protein [Parvularcula bermudensis]ADM09617.1 hypothetical protein PB2503_07809 [Parvularcula bermudensis HTCC2503]
MSFSFAATDPTLTEGVRRIATAQIERALETMETNPSVDHQVHETRKRCKKLRALLRLVRPGLEAYPLENEAIKAAAKRLGAYRDAAARLIVFDRVAATQPEWGPGLGEGALASLRSALIEARQSIRDDDIRQAVEESRVDLLQVLARVPAWEVRPDSGETVIAGLTKVHKKASKTFAIAWGGRDVEDVHEWRKWAKAHWLHLRLLKKIAPMAVMPRLAPLEAVCADLGEHHDLHVIMTLLAERGGAHGGRADEALGPVLSARQRLLEDRAFARGEPFFGEVSPALIEEVSPQWQRVSAPA